MNDKIKILYLLNLDKNEQFLTKVCHDINLWSLYMSIAMREPHDFADKIMISRYITANLKPQNNNILIKDMG